MKKFLVLALTLMMSFGVASVCLASTVYFDYLVTGDAELAIIHELADQAGIDNISFDNKQFAIGADIPMDEFKFGFDLSFGNVDYKGLDFDTFGLKLTGGYAIINDDNLRLDVTAGFYNKTVDYQEFDYTLKSLVIGIDSRINVDKSMWLVFKLNYGFSPEGELSNDYGSVSGDIDSLLITSLKLNYLFTNELGFSLGYLFESFDIAEDFKDEFSGLTIGMIYNF